MKSKGKVLLSSIASIALCSSIAVGGTFALFTSESTVNIAVTSGKVNVVASVDSTSLTTSSMGVAQTAGEFANGGKAGFNDKSQLELSLMSPGDKAEFTVDIANNSNIAIQYKVTFDVSGGLADVLECTATNADDSWLYAEAAATIPSVAISVELPKTVDNNYQNVTDTVITVSVEAVQGNAPIVDKWDGTADTSWYNDTDTEFALSSAEQIAGLAALVDGGNTFQGKTIKLDGDLDLFMMGANGEPVTFDPIGDKVAFEGTFDGQGHTVANLYQSGWALGYEWGSYGSIGLFGEVNGATIKNVTISGAETFVEGGDVGGIVGSATGDCVFENITIADSDIATYNNGLGGIIGWSGAGNYTFKNITIGEDVVLGGLWGSFDSSIGGVVGQAEPGATYIFENVDVACRLDVYNDCTASYDYYNYRMCGMLIGRLEETTTIDGRNYPDTSKYTIQCTNVTVTYGEWADYHYCEPTPGLNNGRGMRVEPGYAYDGLPADFDHTQCVDNHMNLIPFDQVFGGAQIGVKGLPSYEGVTVIYNNPATTITTINHH